MSGKVTKLRDARCVEDTDVTEEDLDALDALEDEDLPDSNLSVGHTEDLRLTLSFELRNRDEVLYLSDAEVVFLHGRFTEHLAHTGQPSRRGKRG